MSALRTLYRRSHRLYQRVFEREEDARTQAIANVLEQTDVFQELSRSALAELADCIHHREYRRDEYLYYENDPGMGAYIIQQGSVRLLAEDEDGAVHELHRVGEGEVIGLLSLVNNLPRMETAQAVIDTRVLGFFRPDLNGLLKRHPRVGAQVMMVLARELARREAELIRRLSRDQGAITARTTVLAPEDTD